MEAEGPNRNSADPNSLPSRNLLPHRHLRIGTRLILCFLVIVVAMLVANLVAIWQLRRTAAPNRILSQTDQLSQAALTVHLDVDTLRNRLTALADTHDGSDFQSEAASLRRKFLADITQAEQLFAGARDQMHDPLILNTLQTLKATLPSQIDKVTGLAEANDWAAVHIRLADQVQGLMDLSALLLERVRVEVSAQQAKALESAQLVSRELLILLPATALLTMLFAILLGWYITRTITGPLSELHAGAQAIARGEFEYEVKVIGEDELATVAKAFNHAAKRLRESYDELRSSEQALRRSERELRDVIETMPVTVWTALPDGAVDFMSRRWEDTTGLPVEQALGWRWEVAIHPDDRSWYIARWRAALEKKQKMEVEVRVLHASGEYRWLLVQNVPFWDEVGNIIKWYGVATDIEDRKRAEKQRERLRQLESDLAHVNRVSTLGELAASISHELNQPIAAAIINADLVLRWLHREPPDLAQVHERTTKIIELGTLASEIINRLRSLYRKEQPKQEALTVNEVVSEMVELLRGQATQHAVSVRAVLGSKLPCVVADRVQVQQVLMNLMLNGIEAMSDTGGVLTVESALREDGQIELSVNDTGPGLPSGKADQIFDAFFTTKPQGSGMGLAISKSIVESHGGRIWATGNCGGGATFHFTLPSDVSVEN